MKTKIKQATFEKATTKTFKDAFKDRGIIQIRPGPPILFDDQD